MINQQHGHPSNIRSFDIQYNHIKTVWVSYRLNFAKFSFSATNVNFFTYSNLKTDITEFKSIIIRMFNYKWCW